MGDGVVIHLRITRARAILAALITWLGNNSVVVVCDITVLDSDVGSPVVYAICIERIHDRLLYREYSVYIVYSVYRGESVYSVYSVYTQSPARIRVEST